MIRNFMNTSNKSKIELANANAGIIDDILTAKNLIEIHEKRMNMQRLISISCSLSFLYA